MSELGTALTAIVEPTKVLAKNWTDFVMFDGRSKSSRISEGIGKEKVENDIWGVVQLLWTFESSFLLNLFLDLCEEEHL